MNKLTDELRQEILLFKQFLKSNNLYGAEAKIEGFSGYLCELLVLKYHTFLHLLERASQWSKRVGIQLEKTYPPHEILKRFSGNLVVIDPIDQYRNVASALSCTNYFTFLYLAKTFQESPHSGFFFKEEIQPILSSDLLRKISSRNTLFIGILFEIPPLVDDVLYPQLKKTSKSIVRFLEQDDISVLRYDYSIDGTKVLFLIELSYVGISNVRKIIGPPITKYDHVKSFLQKYQNNFSILSGPWIEDDTITLEIERDSTIENIVRDILLRDNLGAGKNIKDAIRAAKILFNKDILSISAHFDNFIHSYLNKSVITDQKRGEL